MRPSDRHRSVNFTKDERNLMLALGQKYGHIIKRRNNFSLEKKRLVWNEIYTIFNESSTSGVHRSLESLKKLHLNMKNGKRKSTVSNGGVKNEDEGELTGSSMDYNEESLSSDFEKNEGEINEDEQEIKEEFTPPPLECLLVEHAEETLKINDGMSEPEYTSDPLHLEQRCPQRKTTSNVQQITITDLLKTKEEIRTDKLSIPPDIEKASEAEIKMITNKLNLQLIKKKLDHENELHALKLKKLRLDEEIQNQTLENLRLERTIKGAQLEILQLESDIRRKAISQ